MFDSIASLFCALGVAWTGYTLAFIVANKWADQWYNADGSAHHCEECGSPFLTWCECVSCNAWIWSDARDECVADAMTLGRWLGPLLTVGVVLCLI